MRWYWACLAVLLLLGQASAQDDCTGTDCDIPIDGPVASNCNFGYLYYNYTSTMRFCNIPSQLYFRNTSAELCILIGNNSTMKKVHFYPTVDEYSLLSVANSSTLAWANGCETRILAEVGSYASPVKRRYTDFSDVVPFWTLLIEVSNGILTNVKWDDGCWTCFSEQCVDQTCAVTPATECYPNGETVCDLQVCSSVRSISS